MPGFKLAFSLNLTRITGCVAKTTTLNCFLTTVARGQLGKTFFSVSTLFRNVFATCLAVSVALDRTLRDVERRSVQPHLTGETVKVQYFCNSSQLQGTGWRLTVGRNVFAR